MYKFPIRLPIGWKLAKSQGFHDGHEGNDIVVAGSDYGPRTFGLPFVWPFPFPGRIYDSVADSPIAAEAKKAHAQVDGIDPNTGIAYSILVIHLSGAAYTVAAGQASNAVFHEGDVIGYLGNSGMVSPKPTIERPFDGSHAHIGLGIKKLGEINYTMVDPSIYFDINDPFRGPDDPSRDQPVYDWANIKEEGTFKYAFTKQLRYQRINDLPEVTMLQMALQTLKNKAGQAYLAPGTFGPYGPRTKAAVGQFQADHGIRDPDGPGTNFGPQTRTAMNKELLNLA